MSQLNRDVEVVIKLAQTMTDPQNKADMQCDVSYVHMNKSYLSCVLLKFYIGS